MSTHPCPESAPSWSNRVRSFRRWLALCMASPLLLLNGSSPCGATPRALRGPTCFLAGREQLLKPVAIVTKFSPADQALTRHYFFVLLYPTFLGTAAQGAVVSSFHAHLCVGSTEWGAQGLYYGEHTYTHTACMNIPSLPCHKLQRFFN